MFEFVQKVLIANLYFDYPRARVLNDTVDAPFYKQKLEIQNSENNYPTGRTRRKPIRGDRSEGTPFSRFVPRADPASLPAEPPRRTLADPRLGPPGLSLGLTL